MSTIIETPKQTEEYKRLQATHLQNIPWKKWGPYVSDRQWGTVREDYSTVGRAWSGDAFDYTQSSYRAYRWGEDGIFGISDDRQQLCFALALWNGEDNYKDWEDNDKRKKCIKERFFGLPGMFGNKQGNHMEDVKEYYFYLDNTPTHSYMKALYKYPYNYPYDELIDENEQRNSGQPEYELIDTGCFDGGYFDVMVEYAKKKPNDILIKITVWNQGKQVKSLHILPTLWFRNTWSWGKNSEQNKENLGLSVAEDNGNYLVIKAKHSDLGDYYLYCKYLDYKDYQEKPTPLFTENEINNGKDGINNYLVDSNATAINVNNEGTKASAHYQLLLDGLEGSQSSQSQVIKLRLTNDTFKKSSNDDPFGDDFEKVFEDRKQEADAFYQAITPFDISEEERAIQRQAFAGILWNKQYYNFNVAQWLQGDTNNEPDRSNSEVRKKNNSWTHLRGHDIIVMPDKWEYPYFCVWDSAFHAITLALIDPEFAKEQVKLFTTSRYMKHDGEMPSCEFNFGEGNPPILAWAALKVDEIAQDVYGDSCDKQFLKDIFDNLYSHLNWCWKQYRIPRQSGETEDRCLFSSGFLGLDNISIIDRNQLIENKTITIEQVDAASWLAMYCLNLLSILTKLDNQEQEEYQDQAEKILAKFILISHEINEFVDNKRIGLWDENENFYYEVLKISLEKFQLEIPLKYRSILGIIPLFAVEVFNKNQKTYLTQYLKERFQQEDSILTQFKNDPSFKYLFGEEQGIDIQEDEQEKLKLFSDKKLELFLSIVNRHKLEEILDKLLDEEEFLSAYGIRSLSKIHEDNPYQLDGMLKIVWDSGNIGTFPIEMKYEPGETKAPVHTGNSNWRGPVWFPLNFLLIESLRKYHEYFNECLGENFEVLYPLKSRNIISLEKVALELSNRLVNIFKREGNNQKLAELFATPEDEKQMIVFNEYFNGDTGQGHGSSHQGWTGLVANLIHQLRWGRDLNQ
ncbi:MAG: glucosidase [Crocosphaera sp.]|nr:glucosidase [Crocosphaera sp.]